MAGPIAEHDSTREDGTNSLQQARCGLSGAKVLNGFDERHDLPELDVVDGTGTQSWQDAAL